MFIRPCCFSLLLLASVIVSTSSAQEVGDETIFNVREMELHEEANLDEWIAAKGPGRRKAG